MGYYSPDVLVGDAQRHGVPIQSPDINSSEKDCVIEVDDAGPSVRLGLCYVHGLGESWQVRLIERRGTQPFHDLRDVCRRTHLPRPVLENLIRSGAMDSFGRSRRDLLWALGGLVYHEEGLDLAVPVVPVELPELDRLEGLLWEYELLGLSPGDHVMSVYREQLRARGILGNGELALRQDGETVCVAGLVVVCQRPPSAKGHVFLTLEDEEGLINLIFRPQIYEQYRPALRNAPLLIASGRLEREGRAFSVLVLQAAPLTNNRWGV